MEWTTKKVRRMLALWCDPILMRLIIEDRPDFLAVYWEAMEGIGYEFEFTYQELRQIDQVYRWMRNRLVHFGRSGSVKVLENAFVRYLMTFEDRKRSELDLEIRDQVD